ncbi:MAG: hypothetical protein GY754_08670, partial [bacterium]|nr:hypothetical protein [bacterium]
MNELLQNPNHTKIDFHNHSTYSDGDHEIEKICELKYFLDVLCITNHFPDYPESFYRSKEFQTKYYKNKSENLPELIVGMEYRLENNNELLIFGEKAILN